MLTARGNPVLTDPNVAQANRQIAEEMLEKTKKIVSGRNLIKLNSTAIPIYWQMELDEVIHHQQADLIIMEISRMNHEILAFVFRNLFSLLFLQLAAQLFFHTFQKCHKIVAGVGSKRIVTRNAKSHAYRPLFG